MAYEFAEPIESLRADLRQRFGEQADATDHASFGDARVVIVLDVLEHQRRVTSSSSWWPKWRPDHNCS